MALISPEGRTAMPASPWLPRRWRRAGAALIFVVVLVTVARGLLRPFLDTPEAAGAKLSVEAGTKDSGLRVRGWVDRSRVTVGEPFRTWVTFSNLTPRDSQVESVELYAPGFARPNQELRLYGKDVKPTP